MPRKTKDSKHPTQDNKITKYLSPSRNVAKKNVDSTYKTRAELQDESHRSEKIADIAVKNRVVKDSPWISTAKSDTTVKPRTLIEIDMWGDGGSPSKKSKTNKNTTTKENKNINKPEHSPQTTKRSSKTKLFDRKPTKETKTKPLDIKITTTRKKGTPIVKSESFEKYGVVLPSHDKVLESKKNLEQEKEAMAIFGELFSESIDAIPLLSDSILITPDKINKYELKDCKHLQKYQLKIYFKQFKTDLQNILDGKEYNERHELYKTERYSDKLNFSNNTIVFTEDQRHQLMKILAKNLDPNDKLTDYFFKVLLPELCFKIFVEEHHLDLEEAKQYLEWHPV